MIIDTHVWLSEPNSWGDLTMMDDAMIAAGWTEIGEKTGLNQGMSGEEMVARMDEAGVDIAISHAIKMPHLNAHVPSEFVAGEVAKFPDRLIGMGSVDLLGGLPALREMEEITDMSLIGMKITPAPDYDMDLNDERIMPIYEKAEELGMIIQVHTGWAGYGLLSQQHPLHLDEVSVRFPDLKLIVFRQMNIGPFTDQDRSGVIALWKRVFPDNTPSNAPGKVLDEKLTLHDDMLLVATDQGSVVGTAMAGYDCHRGWLYRVAVSPEHRRRGIGTALVRHAVGSLRKLGCVKVNLQLRADNRSVSGFYESLGFAVEERVSMGMRIR